MALPQGELGSDELIRQLDQETAIRAQRYTELVGHRPRLSIINVEDPRNPHTPSYRYMQYKRRDGEDLGIDVASHIFVTADQAFEQIAADNDDELVSGIIIQLPVRDEARSYESDLLNTVRLDKDVDGLAEGSRCMPATVRGIGLWAVHYGVDLLEEDVALFGRGPLVNGPLFDLLKLAGAKSVSVYEERSDELEKVAALNNATVIVSAMGAKDIQLTPEMFLPDTMPKVIIDAGTTEQSGVQRGDVSPELREYALENGWGITPVYGGVGKITVHALMANLVAAAEEQAPDLRSRQAVRDVLAATSSQRVVEGKTVGFSTTPNGSGGYTEHVVPIP